MPLTQELELPKELEQLIGSMQLPNGELRQITDLAELKRLIPYTIVFSIVANASGSSRYFGYLPPHGKTLATGFFSYYYTYGDLFTILASGLNRYSRKTELNAFAADVLNGTVQYFVYVPTP